VADAYVACSKVAYGDDDIGEVEIYRLCYFSTSTYVNDCFQNGNSHSLLHIANPLPPAVKNESVPVQQKPGPAPNQPTS
jgi:hypothetical protein